MNKKEVEKELIMRELASRSLEYYIKYTMPTYQMTARQGNLMIHKKIIDTLEKVINGEIIRLMIFICPRMGKSELVSKRLPAYFLGKNPNKNVILASYGADLATDFGRKTKQIVTSVEHKNIFPNFKLSNDKKEGGNWETDKGGGYYSVGMGGALTGKGGDLLIIDDLVKDREEAESVIRQQRVIDWYTSTFRTRKQNENSAIIVMMTRWNKNDLAGYLLEEAKNGGDQWEVLSIPAINENGEEIIWEGKWSKGYMKKERENISPKDWSALYMQDPIASGSNIFDLNGLRYFLMSDFEKTDGILKKEDLKVGIFVDPAFSSSSTSDDAVALCIGKHKISGNYYLLDGYAETSAPSKTHKAILSMYDRIIMEGYRIDFIYIEKVNINKEQTKFIEDFKIFLKENNRYIVVNEYEPKGKKEDRIKFGLEPKISLNSIFLRKDMTDKSFIRRLETQLSDFPNNKHDDIIDDLTMGTDILEKLGEEVVQKVTIQRSFFR